MQRRGSPYQQNFLVNHDVEWVKNRFRSCGQCTVLSKVLRQPCHSSKAVSSIVLFNVDRLSCHLNSPIYRHCYMVQ